MPLPWALRGLRDGVVTTRWPRRPDPYFDGFRGSIGVLRNAPASGPDRTLGSQQVLDGICPTGALRATEEVGSTGLAVDDGLCIRCGRCVEEQPRYFAWREGSDVARLRRVDLVSSSGVHDERALAAVRDQLAGRVRRLRRSVHIRHVDAGSDGSDEWEVQALLNPVYDIHRLGIFITPSPRHADILLVTGIGAPMMTAPLRRTREAMPDPVVVVATGTDAISGGLFRDGYGSPRGVGEILDVDVWVPGSPAPPFALLHGLLLGLCRLPLPGPDPRRPR